jgi:RecA-family ATPase
MTIIKFDPTKQQADLTAGYKQAARELGIKLPGEVDPIEFMTATVPQPREHAVPDRILLRQVTLLAGEGGVGKSLLVLQLLASTVLGRGWIGSLPKSGPVIYLGAEDEQDEIYHRLDAIAAHYDDEPATVAELIGNGLHASSHAGEDMTLARFNRKTGIIEPTPLYDTLLEQACDIRPVIVALDTLSDVYGGDENNRTQVSAFVALLRNLAMTANCAVVVTQHPSQAGAKSGDGTSGSTAWHGKVRGRMYLRPATKDEGDPDLRVLEFMKNQYGALAPDVTLRFENGVFRPELGGAGSTDPQIVDEVFLNLLDRFARAGRNVSDKKSPTFAPALFAKEMEATSRKLDKLALTDAMNRLFAGEKIRVATDGPPSKPRSKIVVS